MENEFKWFSFKAHHENKCKWHGRCSCNRAQLHKTGFWKGETFEWVLQTERSNVGKEKYIKHAEEENLNVLGSSGLNSWKTVMLFKNYWQHVDKKWQDSPKPSQEQRDA